MAYLDFELTIGPGTGREYRRAVCSPAGEAASTMRFPFDELALESRLKDLEIALLQSGGRRRVVASPQEGAVQAFGRVLFETLLGGEPEALYRASREQAAAEEKGLRLKLRIEAPELSVLPWEFLYDPARAEYVCLCSDTPLIRWLALPRPEPPARIPRPLRVLGMSASPSDLEPLDIERERQRVEEALGELRGEGTVALSWREGHWSQLQEAMWGGPWHIFYFMGHGGFDRNADEGYIALADEYNETQRLTATQLGRLLADHRPLRLAVLNSCAGGRGSRRDIFSSTAAILLQRGVPAVLAMQHEISDRAAVAFTRTFFRALAAGLPLEGATIEGRKAISLSVNNSVEWGTPVLWTGALEGSLFELEPGAVTPVARTEKRESGEAGPDILPRRQPFEPEMVRIPAGEFVMGTRRGPGDEMPRHTLHLPDYYLARTPVTNAQYGAFVAATGYTRPKHWAGGEPPADIDEHPVVQVSWDDALAYCRWLSQVTGRHYSLPSEAEWEKGARGSDGRVYPWGNEWDAGRCNARESGIGGTTRVGRYSPGGDSPYGLADMAGNVWEWTRSLFRQYPYRPDDGREEESGSGARAIRGSSFNSSEGDARSAYRNHDFAHTRGDMVGFRVALHLPSVPADAQPGPAEG